jgi:agmatine deiminase
VHPDIQVQPNFTKADYEAGVLRINVIWLGDGIDDDTHGHIDDLCRFINEDYRDHYRD